MERDDVERGAGDDEDDERGGAKSEGSERKVRLLSRVHHERLPQPETALQHPQGGPKPGCQRLRGGDAYRVRTQVGLVGALTGYPSLI